jgi:hemolysin activation/secretion protein
MMALFLRVFFLLVVISGSVAAIAQDSAVSNAASTITVEQFVIDNFVAYPQLQITRDTIDAVFATWQKKLGKQLTMQQINGVSDEITRLYRVKGLMLARALVPPQKMTDGIVHLRIEPGVLSEIVVSGQQETRGAIISRPFQPLLRDAVKKSDVEAALAQVDGLPGLDAFSYFSAGDLPGETRINIKVLKEEKNPTQANLRFDNFGNKSTGEYRLLGDVQVANIYGFGERYQLGVLQSLAADSSTLGYLYGSFPFFHAFWRQSIYFSNSQFQLGDDFKILDISGRGHEAHVSWQYDNFFSHQPTFEISLGDYVNRIESEVVGSAVNRDQHVMDLQLGARKSWQGVRQHYALHSIWIGGHQSGQIDNIDADYNAIEVKTFGQWLLNQPKKDESRRLGSWFLDSSLRLLWSDQPLPNHAQLVLAGPSVNRGFLPGIAAADQGFAWQTNLYSPLLFTSPQLQPYFFVDFSGGKRFSLDSDTAQVSVENQLISVGLGLQTQFNPAFSFNLSWGYGLRYDSKINGETTDLLDDDQQLYGTLTYFWQ